MHLCKCSLIFFLHHIYTAQTEKLLNVLISPPMALKTFEISMQHEKLGEKIKATVARCSQRWWDVSSAPVVFVLGLGCGSGRTMCAGCWITQPSHAAHIYPTCGVGRLLWTLLSFCKMTPRHGNSSSLVLLEGHFTSLCHLLGKSHSKYFQKFDREEEETKSFEQVKAFYGIIVFNIIFIDS